VVVSETVWKSITGLCVINDGFGRCGEVAKCEVLTPHLRGGMNKIAKSKLE
jgi:hypothetical protein